MTSPSLPLRIRRRAPLAVTENRRVPRGVWWVALVSVGSVLVAVVLFARVSGAMMASGGPLDVGLPTASAITLKPSTEFGYGLVILEAPRAGDFRVLSARPMVEPSGAALPGSGYALGPERAVGGVQFTKSWPPRSGELQAVPGPLPADIPNIGEGSLEIFVGMRVPDGGLLMNGVEIEYTDGSTLYRTVIPQAVRVCTAGENCPMPPLP